QPAIEPSPAPMSDEITAMWRSGNPAGLLSSVVINVGKLASRFACDGLIDDESSTRNKRSMLRLTTCGPGVVWTEGSGTTSGGCSVRPLQAQARAAAPNPPR